MVGGFEMKIKQSAGERCFDVVNLIIMFFVCVVTLYPFLFVLSSSISSLDAIVKKQVFLLPVDINFDSYIKVFRDKGFTGAYLNSIWYTVVGTIVNVLLTASAAYTLSRKKYSIRTPLMVFIAVTMYFSGGLVPGFILVNNLGLYNTRSVMVILGAISVHQLVIARVFFENNVPEALTEAATIDGANDIVIFFRIAIPLSKAIMAVLTLQYAVSHWNDFFTALVYLPDSNLHPMALYMRRLLITGTAASSGSDIGASYLDEIKQLAVTQQFKYASIIITVFPIACIYPFLQKYFVKGILIGAVKE